MLAAVIGLLLSTCGHWLAMVGLRLMACGVWFAVVGWTLPWIAVLHGGDLCVYFELQRRAHSDMFFVFFLCGRHLHVCFPALL